MTLKVLKECHCLHFLIVALKIQTFYLTSGSPNLIFPLMVFKPQGRVWGANAWRGSMEERTALTWTLCGASTGGEGVLSILYLTQSISEVLLQFQLLHHDDLRCSVVQCGGERVQVTPTHSSHCHQCLEQEPWFPHCKVIRTTAPVRCSLEDYRKNPADLVCGGQLLITALWHHWPVCSPATCGYLISSRIPFTAAPAPFQVLNSHPCLLATTLCGAAKSCTIGCSIGQHCSMSSAVILHSCHTFGLTKIIPFDLEAGPGCLPAEVWVR